MIEVLAFRRDGFDGEITVTAENLPAGVTATPISIGPGQNAGILVLAASEDAAEAVALVSVTGKAKLGQADAVRVARTAAMVWGGVQNQAAARSRISRNLAVAVSAVETAAFAIDPGANLVVEMVRMGTVKFPVKVVRRGEFKGVVALSAVGLPPNLQPKNNTNVDAAQAAGEFEIKLANNSPLGTYSFCLLGVSDVPYARNPEALKAALDRKAVLEKMSADEAAAAKVAADAKAAADKKLADSTAASQKAVVDAQAADKAVADVQAATTTATAKVTECKRLSTRTPPTRV